ncbi:unnamed protein product [Oncorhynchus mykiss]|uniref:Uncharacterized protein n=1 Tax=Oncorhynchus mykiss TaxID=8022 RepID=A0A060XGI8_ONCMY|nr:unnamed protein product [Oncorhynchus mykiss]
MGAKQMKCLSSASPAHSPKEEYIIAQSTDTPKETTPSLEMTNQRNLIQKRCCLSVACVRPRGIVGQRRRDHGRSSWSVTRSSWKRRCRRPGGWCSVYRLLTHTHTHTHTHDIVVN